MQLHFVDIDFAPNPRRVLIYLVEKKVAVPLRLWTSADRSYHTDTFLKMNPAAKFPVMSLDDGSAILDSLAIIEYLEELNPDNPMIGSTPEQRAYVRGLERMATDLLGHSATVVRNSCPKMAAFTAEQNPEAAASALPRYVHYLNALDAILADRPFVAGENISIADVTLCATLDFAVGFAEMSLPTRLTNLARWYDTFRLRLSAGVTISNFQDVMENGCR